MKLNLEKIFTTKFTILGIDFVLKRSIEFDKSIRADEIFSSFYSPQKTELVAKISSADIKEFFSIILERADKKVVEEDFEFQKADEDVIAKICVFFSIRRMKKSIDIQKDSENWMNELIEQ